MAVLAVLFNSNGVTLFFRDYSLYMHILGRYILQSRPLPR